MKRSSGILMAISSLPSPYGIGTLGQAAYDFADFLQAAGQRYWQMLPLGPTSYGDSPYQSFSAYAGNPYFIDPELLIADGLLTKSECSRCKWGGDARHVDYGRIYEKRFDLLHKAFQRGWKRDSEAVAAFAAANARWLPDYALFMACKRHFGMKAWTEWPDDIRLRQEGAPEKYRALLQEDVDFFTYLQYLFFQQWDRLRDYVHGLNIRIIGDLPIYVAMDSADVWAETEFFQLDDTLIPKAVSGVPPDYFSADGQLWGNPLYNWDRMREDGFGWWIRRIDGSGKLFDVIRIDHFRGFDSYWAVPVRRDHGQERQMGQGPGHGSGGPSQRLVPPAGVHRRGSGLPHPQRPAAAARIRLARDEGAGVCLRLPRHQQLPAPHLHGALHLLHRHPRQQPPDPVAAGGQAGGHRLRQGLLGPDGAGGLPLGCHPRRHEQRRGVVRGPGCRTIWALARGTA